MKRYRMFKIVLTVLLLMLVAVTTAWASSSQNYSFQKQVLSSGGGFGVSDSGTVALRTTLGQAIIGESSSPGNTLIAGFWGRIAGWAEEVFLPLVLND